MLGASHGVTPLVSGQRLRRRVEEQPHQRPKRRGIRRRHLHIERHRRLGAHEVAHGEVRSRQRPLHVLARQPFQIGARRALHRGAETVMHGRVALHRRLDEGMGLRFAIRARTMQGLQHDVRRLVEVGQKLTDLQQRLVLIIGRVEDMKDHSLQNLRGRLVPDGLLVPGPARVRQDGDQPLHLGQFSRTGLDFGQRVPPGGGRVPGPQIKSVRESGPPSGRHGPQFALGIVDQHASRPGQQARDHMPPALAAARAARHQGRPEICRRQQPSTIQAQNGARPPQQSGPSRFAQASPSAPPANR
ncbi:hypothetical protein D3C77_207990 [compost metagenome]